MSGSYDRRSLRQRFIDLPLSPCDAPEVKVAGTVDACLPATCEHQWTVAYSTRADKSMVFFLFCLKCRRYDYHALPHGLVYFRWKKLEYPMPPYIATAVETVSCEVCGRAGAQLHHWAPQAVFRNAWDWPTSYLCISCHMEWHKVMAANGLRLERAA